MENIKKNRKAMMYVGFLFTILLISSVYYVKADQAGINANATSFVVQTDPIVSSKIVVNSTVPTTSHLSLGSIEGQVFEDLNANGIKNLEQAGLAGDEVILVGWQIDLKGKDIANRPVGLTTTTDSNGHYYFLGLTDGNYVIREKLPSNWVQTSPSSSLSYNVTIMNGSDIFGQDFGNFHKGKINGGLRSVRKKDQISEEGSITKTFGIVAEWPSGSCNPPQCLANGRIEYQDNSTNLNMESIQIKTVATTLDKRKGVITGLAKVNGAGSYPFVLYVEDDSENNLLDISLPTYRYSNRVIMSGGNIQLDK